jgi:uncharacterized protein with PIN domain
VIGISIVKFAKLFIKNNSGEKYEDVVKRLKETLKRKNEGARCQVCGQPIWAIGSAIGGFDRCFTCITGENDDSGDYEIY